jgi:hypothetical protein
MMNLQRDDVFKKEMYISLINCLRSSWTVTRNECKIHKSIIVLGLHGLLSEVCLLMQSIISKVIFPSLTSLLFH